jgi:hypothetical protein
MWVGSEACECGLAHHAPAVAAYNEEAFRHFLALERKRSERACRSFLLLLVALRREPAARAAIPQPLAAKVFAALATCVREVDFVGWYREDRIAGAVLIQGAAAPEPDAPKRIAARVTDALRSQLPSPVVQRLQVRVLHRVGA